MFVIGVKVVKVQLLAIVILLHVKLNLIGKWLLVPFIETFYLLLLYSSCGLLSPAVKKEIMPEIEAIK